MGRFTTRFWSCERLDPACENDERARHVGISRDRVRKVPDRDESRRVERQLDVVGHDQTRLTIA